MKKTSIFLAALTLGMSLSLTSCGDKDKKEDDNDVIGGGDLSGEVSGTLEKGVYVITSDITVPEGKTLTLKPGVVFAFDGDGLTPESSPELKLDGNLVAIGTAEDPILFTLVEEKRKVENAYEGMWGGIQASSTTDHVVLKHCLIELCGGPADGNRPDIYDAGDPRYTLHFGNPAGTLIMENCTIRNVADDCIRPQGGGKMAFVKNVFYNIGETGGEGINFKDGSVGDVCYNLFYGVATNGSKPAGKGDGVPQTNINNYNNTFVNNGFRRVQSGRGGSINYESGAKGLNYNNIIVNCRFGLRFRGDRLPDVENTKYGYTLYYATDATDRDNFFPSSDVKDEETLERWTVEQTGDILNKDPKFVNYAVSTDKMTNQLNSAWNFKLKSDSPGKGTGKTDFQPVHTSLSAGGYSITLPAPSADFGAFGAE